jgi:hypothetical protein
MTIITQRKKGWWRFWVLIAIVAIIAAVVGVLAYLKNADGEPYINLTPVDEGIKQGFTWAAESTFNYILLSIALIIVGIFFAWLYYTQLRGQKVTTSTPTNNYVGQSAVSQQPVKTDTETTVSS